MFARHLMDSGVAVRDVGAGTAYMSGVDTLVYLPLLMPTANADKAVGGTAARMTFAAAAEGKVGRVVVLSRVGPEGRHPYLEALRHVEASAAQVCSKVTVIRTAHPVGDLGDGGPVVEALLGGSPGLDWGLDSGGDPDVQPVCVADLLDVLTAAADGRIGTGFVEIGGPRKMTLSSLRGLVASGSDLSARSRTRTRTRVWPGRRRAAEATERFLALESVPKRKLTSPLGAATRDLEAAWTS